MQQGFSPLLDVKAALGECPLWSVSEQVLYFVDIKRGSIHRYDPVKALLDTIQLPEEVGCIGLVGGGGFIAGLRSGLWRLDAQGRLLDKLADNPEDQVISRFNDGGCDPLGRFIVGTIDETRKNATAKLYRYDGAGLECLSTGLLTSNGVAFSPDGRRLYHADTPRYEIYTYDYDPASGKATNRQIFARLDPQKDKGRPDGAAVDIQGCYWVALYEGGRVQRYAPDGKLMAQYSVPAKCPTMVAFGGADMKTVYCTSASIDRPAEELALYPFSGALFSMRSDVAGLARPLFNPDC